LNGCATQNKSIQEEGEPGYKNGKGGGGLGREEGVLGRKKGHDREPSDLKKEKNG